MNYQEQLITFIENGGTYNQGVEIYNALGTDDYLKNFLFARGQNTFSFERLKKELALIHQDLSVVLQAPTIINTTKPRAVPGINNPSEKEQKEYIQKRGISIDDFFNLPHELQRSRMEIGQLYPEIVTYRKAIRAQLPYTGKGKITLQEAFDIMFQLDSRGRAIPFNIMWITYDSKTDTGGELKHLDCVLKHGNKTGSKYKAVASAVSDRRDPRHDIHGTINLQICNSFELRKAHTWLIFMLNGYDVILGNNG